MSSTKQVQCHRQSLLCPSHSFGIVFWFLCSLLLLFALAGVLDVTRCCQRYTVACAAALLMLTLTCLACRSWRCAAAADDDDDGRCVPASRAQRAHPCRSPPGKPKPRCQLLQGFVCQVLGPRDPALRAHHHWSPCRGAAAIARWRLRACVAVRVCVCVCLKLKQHVFD